MDRIERRTRMLSRRLVLGLVAPLLVLTIFSGAPDMAAGAAGGGAGGAGGGAGGLPPVGTGALTFEGRDLEPGHTSVSTLVVLLRMSEGTFESELRVSVGEQLVLTRPFQFV